MKRWSATRLRKRSRTDQHLNLSQAPVSFIVVSDVSVPVAKQKQFRRFTASLLSVICTVYFTHYKYCVMLCTFASRLFGKLLF